MSDVELRIKSIFEKILNRNEIILTPQMTHYDIEGWTSVTNVRIIVAIEKEFKVKFQPSEIVALKTVGDLFEKVKSKLEGK